MRIKKILIIVGAVIAFLISVWFLLMSKRATDEIYVLPDGYEGPVIVLMEREDGESKKYDRNGNRLYEVPGSGVLKTQFEFQEGYRRIQYFREDGQELSYLWPSDEVWNDTCIFDIPYVDSVYVYGASYARDYWFYVGKVCDKHNLYDMMDDKWEEIRMELNQ